MIRAGRSRGRFPIISFEFFIDIILPAALWPSNRKENQEYFSGLKAAGAYGCQTYNLRAPNVLLYGSLTSWKPHRIYNVCFLFYLCTPYAKSRGHPKIFRYEQEEEIRNMWPAYQTEMRSHFRFEINSYMNYMIVLRVTETCPVELL